MKKATNADFVHQILCKMFWLQHPIHLIMYQVMLGQNLKMYAENKM